MEIESGWYMFRIKYITKTGETSVGYCKYKIMNKAEADKRKNYLIELYNSVSKNSSAQITYKFDSRISENEPQQFYFD